MKFKSFVCACLLSGFVASGAAQASWFSSVRFMPIVKAVKNVCCTHKKTIIAGGVAVMAAAFVACKKPSLWTSTINLLSSPFKKLYAWMRGKGQTVVALAPAVPAPAVPTPVVPATPVVQVVPVVTPLPVPTREPIQPAQEFLRPLETSALEEVGSRISASLLAAATGDAMGRPTEFLDAMEKITRAYPRGIQSLEDIRGGFVEKNDKHVAPYTDDTRMAMLVMEELIQFRRWATQQGAAQGQTFIEYINAHFDAACHRIMTKIAIRFIRDCNDPWGWRGALRAPGNACMRGVDSLSGILHAHGLDALPDNPEQYPAGWWRLNNDEGGCGSVMHAYPFGLVLYDAPELAARLAAEHSQLTHGAPIAISACASMAMGTALSLRKLPVNEIFEHMCRTARRYDLPGYPSQTASLIEQAIGWARNTATMSQEAVFNQLRGWSADQAVAAAAYIFASKSDDVRRALHMGVHTPGDSDSIASLAGALVGARVGMSQISPEWRRNLEDAQQLAYYGEQVMGQE